MVDRAPTGLADVDFILAWIADPRRRTLAGWLALFADADPRRTALQGLVQRNLVEVRETRVLGLPTATKYPAVERGPEAALRARLELALSRAADADPRDACLCRLIEAAELGPSTWGEEWERQRERIELMPRCRVADTVRRVCDRAGRTAAPTGLAQIEHELRRIGAMGMGVLFTCLWAFDDADRAPGWLLWPALVVMVIGVGGGLIVSVARKRSPSAY